MFRRKKFMTKVLLLTAMLFPMTSLSAYLDPAYSNQQVPNQVPSQYSSDPYYYYNDDYTNYYIDPYDSGFDWGIVSPAYYYGGDGYSTSGWGWGRRHGDWDHHHGREHHGGSFHGHHGGFHGGFHGGRGGHMSGHHGGGSHGGSHGGGHGGGHHGR